MNKCPECGADFQYAGQHNDYYVCGSTFFKDGRIDHHSRVCMKNQLAAIELRLAKDKNGKVILPGMKVRLPMIQRGDEDWSDIVISVGQKTIVTQRFGPLSTCQDWDADQCEIVEAE